MLHYNFCAAAVLIHLCICSVHVFQVNASYLQSLPRDCCLICHAPRTDIKGQPYRASDTMGISRMYEHIAFMAS